VLHIYTIEPLDPTASYFIPFHTLTFYVFNTHVTRNIILNGYMQHPWWSLPVGLMTTVFRNFSLPAHVHAPFLSSGI
jgi:hypothetical protein